MARPSIIVTICVPIPKIHILRGWQNWFYIVCFSFVFVKKWCPRLGKVKAKVLLNLFFINFTKTLLRKVFMIIVTSASRAVVESVVWVVCVACCDHL